MEVYGREVHFARTVGSTCDIIELCPDENLDKMDDLFEGSLRSSQETAAKIMVIMHKAYEECEKYKNPDYIENPLTIKELFTLSEEAFSSLFREALNVWLGEKATILAEDIDKGKKNEKTS